MAWASVVAAVVAAVVSIGGAVMSFISARKAEKEARSITTLNHNVAALDRQAEQLREDYRGLMKAIGDIQGAGDVGSIMAAGELLGAHPRASEPLSVAIRELIGKLGQSFVTRDTEGMDVVIASIRDGFRESLAEIERMRSGLLG